MAAVSAPLKYTPPIYPHLYFSKSLEFSVYKYYFPHLPSAASARISPVLQTRVFEPLILRLTYPSDISPRKCLISCRSSEYLPRISKESSGSQALVGLSWIPQV